jgi:hypothetical protein
MKLNRWKAKVSKFNGWSQEELPTKKHLGQSIAYARSNGVVPPWSK